MRVIILSALIWAIAAFPALADDRGNIKKEYTLKSGEEAIFKGAYKSMIPAGLTRTDSTLIASDENGSDVEFRMGPAVVIYNSSDGKFRSLNALMPGEDLEISYRSGIGGAYSATAVKVIIKKTAPVAASSDEK